MMKNLIFRKYFLVLFLFSGLTALTTGPAYAAFSVDWGVSLDNGKYGYVDLGSWFVDNGYYDDASQAQNFAKTGYIGYDSTDQDPYYWDISTPVTVEIVREMAGYKDYNTLGYYTGGGYFKSLTEVFGGQDSGPETFSVNAPFGLFIDTKVHDLWFTDRGENDIQDGTLRRSGGNAQALIYELVPEREWLIAWEDLDATQKSSDRDYNDMYVKMSTIPTTVPEPIGSILFLLGGGVLMMVKKRSK